MAEELLFDLYDDEEYEEEEAWLDADDKAAVWLATEAKNAAGGAVFTRSAMPTRKFPQIKITHKNNQG